MDNTSMAIIAVLAVAVIAAAVAAHYYKRKSQSKLFEQAYESSKQVPKQKKKSFLLLMFMEAVSASMSKSKSTAGVNKLNNPKYLEVQLLQMSKIIKSGTKGQNKKTKRAIRMLKDYQAWEEEKSSKETKAKQNKTA